MPVTMPSRVFSALAYVEAPAAALDHLMYRVERRTGSTPAAGRECPGAARCERRR